MSGESNLKNAPIDTPTLADGRSQSTAQSSDSELLGTLLDGKYRIIERVGQGGMGRVYKAHHELLDRMVAVKFLHANLLDSEGYVERFRREASVAGSLNHPNAIALFDYGLLEGLPFLVMQYVEGRTLKQVLLNEGAMTLSRIESILTQIGGALAQAHALGIVHRDLKPDNIMLAERSDGAEWAWILDFGIAKPINTPTAPGSVALTRAGMLMGTPQYMSPEQALDQPCDTRSDIYSLGCILYEMLTGDVPFKSSSIVELMYQQVSKTPIPAREFKKELHIPQLVSDVVMKALEKDPTRRVQTVGELVAAFSEAVHAAPPGHFDALETAFSSTMHSAASTMHSVGAAAESKSGRRLIIGGLLAVSLLAGVGAMYEESALPGGSRAPQGVLEPVVNENKPTASAPAAAKALGVIEISFQFFPPSESTSTLAVAPPPLVVPPIEVQSPPPAAVEPPVDSVPEPEPAPVSVQVSEPEPEAVIEDLLSAAAISAQQRAEPRKESKQDAERLYAEGQRLFNAREYGNAAAKFREAILSREKHLGARLSLGASLLRLGKPEQALEHFKIAEAQNSQYPPTIYNLASYYATVGDTERAVEELKRAFTLYPKLRSWPANDPDFDRIRDKESFKALFSR